MPLISDLLFLPSTYRHQIPWLLVRKKDQAFLPLLSLQHIELYLAQRVSDEDLSKDGLTGATYGEDLFDTEIKTSKQTRYLPPPYFTTIN